MSDILPQHIAIIMDGNGRWAKAKGLPRTEGHKKGAKNLERVLKALLDFGKKGSISMLFLRKIGNARKKK